MLPSILLFLISRIRHTRYTRDWSSDVCSSDLARRSPPAGQPVVAGAVVLPLADQQVEIVVRGAGHDVPAIWLGHRGQIGLASLKGRTVHHAGRGYASDMVARYGVHSLQSNLKA